MTDTGIKYDISPSDASIFANEINLLTESGISTQYVYRQDNQGNTIGQTPIWWRTYDEWTTTIKEINPKLLAFDFAKNLTNYTVRFPGVQITNTDFIAIANLSKVPTSFFNAGGGSGRSSAQRQNDIRNLTVSISNRARQLGIPLSGDQIAYIATAADQMDYSNEQLAAVLDGLVNWENLQPGVLTDQADAIKQKATQYLVNLSEDTVRDYSRRIAAGSMSADTVDSILRTQAKQSLPWMKEVIDQGLSPLDVLSAGRDQVARSLEISVGEVNLMDQKYLDFLTTKDSQGNTRLATQSEIQKNVRRDIRWQKTNEARETAVGIGQTLAEIFGRSTF